VQAVAQRATKCNGQAYQSNVIWLAALLSLSSSLSAVNQVCAAGAQSPWHEVCPLQPNTGSCPAVHPWFASGARLQRALFLWERQSSQERFSFFPRFFLLPFLLPLCLPLLLLMMMPPCPRYARSAFMKAATRHGRNVVMNPAGGPRMPNPANARSSVAAQNPFWWLARARVSNGRAEKAWLPAPRVALLLLLLQEQRDREGK